MCGCLACECSELGYYEKKSNGEFSQGDSENCRSVHGSQIVADVSMDDGCSHNDSSPYDAIRSDLRSHDSGYYSMCSDCYFHVSAPSSTVMDKKGNGRSDTHLDRPHGNSDVGG